MYLKRCLGRLIMNKNFLKKYSLLEVVA